MIGSFILHKYGKVLIPVFVSLAICSPIHFFNKCSPELDGLAGTSPRPPPGLPQSLPRIPAALTPASN